MSSRIIYFMYHHTHHCLIPREPHPIPSHLIFTLFSLLPIELRLKIWEEVANFPRSIELTCTPPTTHLPSGRWFSHSLPPAIFRISNESRSVAFRKYEILKFKTEQMGIPPSVSLWINFEAETLHLCGDLHVEWARDLLLKNEQLKRKLRRVSVKESTWRELNQVLLTPVRDVGEKEEVPKAVWCGLKTLVDVRFHSAVISMP